MEVNNIAPTAPPRAIIANRAHIDDTKVKEKDDKEPVREISPQAKQLASTGTIDGVGNSLDIVV